MDIYVIKNVVTKKYVSKSWGWTKHLHKAEVYEEYYVVRAQKNPEDWYLGRNEKYVAIKLIEA
jgi:hypothetical protein